MLPKQNRISTGTIQSVLKNGRLFRSHYGVLYVKKTPTLDIKGTVIVGKKVSKQATKRNYLKRVVRSVVIQNTPCMQPGTHFVIVLKPSIHQQPFHNIKQYIEHLFFIAQIVK